MRARALHPWHVSYRRAIAIQDEFRPLVRLEPLTRPVHVVAGADVAYSRSTERVYAAVAVVTLPSLDLIETVGVTRRATFPYIPGLLSFRELPPLITAFEHLSHEPDLLLFDGQGLAHPRRFGLACHAGVVFDKPSVGCAKSRLIGLHGVVGPMRGARATLIDDDEAVGVALRTRSHVRPMFVSPGHLVDIDSAAAVVLASTGRYRLPEPLRRAHHVTTALRRRDEEFR